MSSPAFRLVRGCGFGRQWGAMALAAGFLVLGEADYVEAQQVTIGGGGTGGGLIVAPAVPPHSEQSRAVRMEDLLPRSVPVALYPAPVSFVLPDGRAAGPFAYGDGLRVELGGARYEFTNATGAGFQLRAGGGALEGPFAYRDGAQVRLGAREYDLKTAEPHIRCRLALSDVPMSKVRLALVPLRGEAAAQLARLRAAYARIGLELAAEREPYQLIGPVVYGPSGYRRDATVERSAADIARAETAADGRARQAFEYFQDHSGARLATVLKQSDFHFRGLAPGSYAVCVMADVSTTKGGGRLTRTTPRIWWATATLLERECAFVLLEQQVGRDWRELFDR